MSEVAVYIDELSKKIEGAVCIDELSKEDIFLSSTALASFIVIV